MSGLNALLETARRALITQQIGIAVTSHNVSNASTPGYSRQQVTLVPTLASKETFGYLGTGVMAESVTRIRDKFLDQQVQYSNSATGEADMQQQILSQVEASINEPSDAGLSSAMTNFFNSFQDLSLHPEESTARNGVIQQGTLMSDTFHRLHNEISQLQSSLVDDASAKVTQINQLTSEISDLDVRITNAGANGAEPSDLLDQRDLRIEELSKLANVTVGTDPKCSVMVSIGNTMVASRAGSVPLSVVQTGSQINIATSSGNVPVTIGGGELGGVQQLANTTLPGYLSQLDTLAGAMINRVNALHSTGYGTGTPPPTGVTFFSGTTAADIAVNPAVASDPSMVAASADGTSGNNDIALAISNIVNEPLLSGNTLTLAQYYNGVASGVGSAINGAEAVQNSQQLIMSQLESQRSSVSGVSLDEEMTNLIQYQRAYQAAARLVNTTNEMFQSIIDMVA